MTRRAVVLSVLLLGAATGGPFVAQSAADRPDCSVILSDGTGSADDPYRVSTVAQLACVRTDRDAHYELVSDIDAGTNGSDGGGFERIGDPGAPFNGTVDGNGHTIRNLTIEHTDSDGVGLFGAVGTDGRVVDLTVENATVRGGSDVGGLVGSNAGTVERSSFSGTVTGTSNVGGLVGSNAGTVERSSADGRVDGIDDVGGLLGSNSGRTNLSTAAASVEGTNSVGGLVGDNAGTVVRSYATGDVGGDETEWVGGLLGYNDGGTVARTYATGAVTADDTAGGLVGYNTDGTVTDSYAAGSVTGTDRVGGLVGRNDGTVADGYWDTGTTGQNTSAGSGAEGLSTGEMQGRAAVTNMSRLDFGSNWQARVDGHPALGWQSPVTDDGYVTAGVLSVDAPGVLGNDVVRNGTAPTATVETTPAHGTVHLDANGSFTYEPDPGFTGTDTFTYRTGDGRNRTGTVTIEVYANATTVSVDAADRSVMQGETLDGTVTVTGNERTSVSRAVTIALVWNGTTAVSTTETVSLNDGRTGTVPFGLDTTALDGNYTLTVSADDAVVERSVTVRAPAAFEVRIVSVTDPVLSGETLRVNGSVENTGDVSGTTTVSFGINGTRYENRNVTLAGGESTVLTFARRTRSDADGYAVVVLRTPNGSTRETVEMRRPAVMDVRLDTMVSTAGVGDTVAVNATVENTGEVFGNGNVSLVVDDTVVDSRAVAVGPGMTRQFALEWTPTAAGNYTLSVVTADDTAVAQVAVIGSAGAWADIGFTVAAGVAVVLLAVGLRLWRGTH